MSQIEDLGQRITAALDRIDRAVEGMGASADASEVADLKQALEDERLANAQLEERVKAIKDKQDARLSELEANEAKNRETLAELDDQLQRLRKANEQLRKNNVALRDANSEGVGEPHLINKAMLAELEGLRASRSSDASEAAAILDALKPLVENATVHGGDS